MGTDINKTSLKIIDYVLNRFNSDFYFIHRQKNIIIETLLSNELIFKIVSKNIDTIHNEYMEYYDKSYKMLIVDKFVSNLLYLSSSSFTINKFVRNNNISSKFYNQCYELLINIALSNVNSYNLILLFKSLIDYEKQYFSNCKDAKTQTIFHFKFQYEYMIQEYYRKKDAIAVLNL